MIKLAFLICWMQLSPIEVRLLSDITEAVRGFYPDSTFQTSVSIKWLPSVLRRVQPEDIVSITYSGRSSPVGTGVFSVQFAAGGRTLNQHVQVDIAVKQLLPVFSRRVLSGERISSDETHFAWIDLVPGMGDLIADPAALDSVVVTGIILPGQPVKRAEVKIIPVVLPGQMLNMTFENSGLNVSLACKAREEAALGERIRVWSDATRKNYLVKITGKDSAQWVSTL